MKKFLLISILATSIPFLTSCSNVVQNIENVSAKGLTLRVSADELSSRLEDDFPIVKNLPYGEVELTNPKAILKKGSDRIVTGTTIKYENDNLPEQKGSLYISGSPYFDASTGNIFLRSPKIEKMSFNGVDLFDYVKKPIIDALQPVIDNIFLQHPIYKVDRSSIANSFIKSVSVDNGALLITFGL